VATILTFSSGWERQSLSWSKQRHEAKMAKLLTKTIFPEAANPAAMPTMFCSV